VKSGLVFWGALSFAWNLGFSRLSYGLVLPTLRHDFSGSYASFGMVNSSNLIGYFLGMLAAPALLKKFGRPIELSAAATCILVVTFAASAASRTLNEIALLRFILGFASAIASILVISITMARTHESRRGLAAGLLWAGLGLGVAICGLAAPVVAGAHPQVSWRELWLLMASVGPAILVGFTYHAARAAKVAVLPRHPNAASGDTDAHATAIVLGATFFAFGAGYIIYFTFVSALSIEYGFHPASVGLLWGICGFAGVFGGLFAGRAMDYPIAFVVLPIVLGLGALGALLSSIHAVVAVIIGAAMMGSRSLAHPRRSAPCSIAFRARLNIRECSVMSQRRSRWASF